MFEAPRAYFLHDGQQVDAFQGEVVNKFLFVCLVGAFGKDAFSFIYRQKLLRPGSRGNEICDLPFATGCFLQPKKI
ncbi:MAG: hypothetical protein BGO55_14205 [Sphingobacteriales bacterium 50-39]|nr:MAG: hypothetical protein BGO55_14205 [Sphingobacteriales bacterium 50-39]